jgi:UDP-N-acetylmuramoylalanine--D-glutamate ligase
MDEYVDAKKNIFLYQISTSRLVLNNDNDITKSFSGFASGECIYFGINKFNKNGTYLDGEDILMNIDGNNQFIMKKNDIILPGIHNVANYLAAIAAVWGYVSIDTILEVAKNFSGVEHRIEFVRELNEIRFYNEAKASRPTRTKAALDSFSQEVIIICGGYDKKIPFEPMSDKIIDKVVTLVLVGQTSDKIEKAIISNERYEGKPQIIKCSGFREAIVSAYESAKPGDIVVLSPACASFDLFKNFEERGNAFKSIVNSL